MRLSKYADALLWHCFAAKALVDQPHMRALDESSSASTQTIIHYQGDFRWRESATFSLCWKKCLLNCVTLSSLHFVGSPPDVDIGELNLYKCIPLKT